MTIKEFIEKSIDGGYGNGREHFLRNLPEYALFQVWLDPLAWQAVGEVDGWEDVHPMNVLGECLGCGKDVDPGHVCKSVKKGYVARMHDMINFLVEGKSVEQFLETL